MMVLLERRRTAEVALSGGAAPTTPLPGRPGHLPALTILQREPKNAPPLTIYRYLFIPFDS